MGLLPILVNGIYSKFPFYLQMILGNGLAAGTITAVLLNIAFNYIGVARKSPETAEPAANVSRV
jgi:xanthine/uracil permease